MSFWHGVDSITGLMKAHGQKWQRIIGTAGHIDHGKTTLVHALTGVDTDTLDEEKERGISINLGFAPLELDDLTLAFVDVPGHERFIKNMVAGSSGIDVGLLVVAADQGVQPQTREHLTILELLGVKHGVIALTRIDVLEEQNRMPAAEIVQQELRGLVKDSFLEGAPVVVCSATKKTGLDELKTALKQAADQVETSDRSKKPFRMYVDRTFAKAGFGTVVTGSVYRGECRVGDEVVLYPDNLKTAVRRVESFLKQVESGQAGMRLALNLQHADHDAVERGACLTEAGHIVATKELLVKLNVVGDEIKHNSWLQVHWGTSQVRGRVLNRSFSGSNYALLKLDDDVFVKFADRLVLRGHSPVTTAAGATVLVVVEEAKAFGSKTWKPEELDVLAAAAASRDYQAACMSILNRCRARGASIRELARLFDVQADVIVAALKEPLEDFELYTVETDSALDCPILTPESLGNLKKQMVQEVMAYIGKHPENPVLSQAELRKKAGEAVPLPVFKRATSELIQEETFAATKDGGFSMPEALAVLKKRPKPAKNKLAQQATNQASSGQSMQRIEEIVRAAELTPPTLAEVAVLVDMPRQMAGGFLKSLTREGRVVRLPDDLYLHREALEVLTGMLKDYFNENESLSIGEFKTLTQSSRKYSVPMLEYLDKKHLTVRGDDNRRSKGPKL